MTGIYITYFLPTVLSPTHNAISLAIPSENNAQVVSPQANTRNAEDLIYGHFDYLLLDERFGYTPSTG